MNLLKGRELLVVDDDDLMREVLSDVFKREGALVTQAESGIAAFILVKQKRFDAVVSDVHMAGGDGIDLARRIASLERHKPEVFICSGFNDLAPELIKELNIRNVFEKPFDQKSMVRMIAASLPTARE